MTRSTWHALISVLVFAAAQQPTTAKPLEMRSVEACSLKLTPIGIHPRWSGWIDYDVDVGSSGEPTTIVVRGALPELRIFSAFVEGDRLEACLRRWRFGSQGPYQVRLFAGTMYPDWRIVVKQGDREFTMTIPYKA